MCEEPLRGFILFCGPQHHAWRSDGPQPLTGRLDQRAGDASPLRFRRNHDIVNETGRFSEFLPRLRLQLGVNVSDYGIRSFGDEDRHIVFLQLRPEKPRVARLRIAARRHESLWIEGVVRSEQRGAELPKDGHVGARRAADGERVRRQIRGLDNQSKTFTWARNLTPTHGRTHFERTLSGTCHLVQKDD